MDRDTIIRLAEEAGLEPRLWNHTDAFERFAALVAAEKDKEIKMLAKALKAEQKKNKALISVMSDGTEIAVRLAVRAERQRIVDMLLDMHAKEERHNNYLFIANIIKESA